MPPTKHSEKTCDKSNKEATVVSLSVSLEVEEKIYLDYSHCECLEISLRWFLPLLWINSSKSRSAGSLGHNERKNKSWKIKGLRRSLGWASICFKWEWRKSLCFFVFFRDRKQKRKSRELSLPFNFMCLCRAPPSSLRFCSIETIKLSGQLHFHTAEPQFHLLPPLNL